MEIRTVVASAYKTSMSIRSFSALLFLVSFSVSGDLCLAAETPNILVIPVDDLGYANVGFNGCWDIPTPNIDALAKSGVRCTSGYVTHPYYGPTRAGLLTGRCQQRFGHENNPARLPESTVAGLPLSQTTIAQALKTAGHVTGCVANGISGRILSFIRTGAALTSISACEAKF